MKDVKVLVSSCACNQKFLALVDKVVKENGIAAKVSAVTDIMEQMQYDVMSLPALVVDGKVVARPKGREGTCSDIEIIHITMKRVLLSMVACMMALVMHFKLDL